MGVNAVSDRACYFTSLTLSPVAASCSGRPLRGDAFPEQSVKESMKKKGRYTKSESERSQVNKKKKKTLNKKKEVEVFLNGC